MIIKEIEYENFRQFKNKGRITFSTDGKITLIYGSNGDGKTTLHQLISWILYGETNFNSSTNNDILYHISYKKAQSGTPFTVKGQMIFEHDDINFMIQRSISYQKTPQTIRKYDTDVVVLAQEEYGEWEILIDNEKEVQDFIEDVLPSGLKKYFLFDGESMIIDLWKTGNKSAKTLRNAIYTIFDLKYLESGIEHIGDEDKSFSVIYNLYHDKKGEDESQLSDIEYNLHNNTTNLNNVTDEIKGLQDKYDQKLEKYKLISQIIGSSSKSNGDIEAESKKFRDNIELSEKQIQNLKKEFGNTLYEKYSYLILQEKYDEAVNVIERSIDCKKETIPGLNIELLNTLLNSDTCVCGHRISNNEYRRIEELKNSFVINFYDSGIGQFQKDFEKIVNNYFDKENELSSILNEIISFKNSIIEFEKLIAENNQKIKENLMNSDLIEERKDLEKDINDLNEEILNKRVDEGILNKENKNLRKSFDKLTENNKNNELINIKIDLMKDVKDSLKNELNEKTDKYSKSLERNITDLINKISTTKYLVEVNNDFTFSVHDSFNDESKSDGQFAAISFAYIGAVFKLLNEEETLKNKKYPLVLDGPFSKLDSVQRQNVIDVIPEYAPQIILFSKDSLQDLIPEEKIGKIWTIESNDEKNDSKCWEGYRW